MPDVVLRLKNCKKYKGAHNTNIRDNNIGWLPNAQDIETVIANAYNGINGICNLKKIDKENLTTSENIINYYIDNKDIYDKIALYIPKGNSEFSKLVNQKNSVSSKWKKLGNYTSSDKVDNTPKTDIISNFCTCGFQSLFCLALRKLS